MLRAQFGTSSRRASALSAALLSAALAVSACGADDSGGSTEPGKPFYEGKTIEVVVPFAAGGGTDAVGRAIAEMLSDELEGSPTVQVINIDGADGLLGHNQFAGRDADGETLFLGGGSGNIYELFGAKDKKFKYADWQPLVGVLQGTAFYGAPDAVSGAADLVNPKTELRFGSGSAEGSDLARLYTLDWIGAKFRPIFGYEGAGAARTAFQQGETNLGQDTTAQFNANVKPLVSSSDAVPLMSMGMIKGDAIERDPGLDMPSAAEIYKQVKGADPAGVEYDAMKMLNGAVSLNKILFIQNGIPQEAKDALNAAIGTFTSHPKYKDFAAATGPFGGYDITTGSDLQALYDSIFSGDKTATVEYVRTYALDKYQARIGEAG